MNLMAISKSRAAKVILTLLVVLIAAAFAFSSKFYTEALADAFFAFALASVVILHLRVQPRWSDAAFVLVTALLLGIVDFRVLHYSPRVMAWVSLLGLGGFLIMAIRIVWATDSRVAKALLYAWIPAMLFVTSEYYAATMLEWTGAAHPKTLDLYLLSFDYSLRVPLAFLVGQQYYLRSWLHNASLLAYVALGVPIGVVYAGRLVRFKQRAFPAMLAFLVTGPLGILFYNLFPACGPHALFQQGFPFRVFPMDQVPRVLLGPIAIPGPRNAMPSLHMAWVLLAWWYSRGLSWFERVLAFAFLSLTTFATLGTGEHWFVDLIVAFPFALFIQAICAYFVPWRDSRRLSALIFGLLCTLAWLVMLRYEPRFFWTSPVVPWALAIATVALASIRQRKLDQCTEPASSMDGLAAESESLSPHEVSVPAN